MTPTPPAQSARTLRVSLEADRERATTDQGWRGAATFFNVIAKHHILYQETWY